MKPRLLIIEPSWLIVHGLKAVLESADRFKLLEPIVTAAQLVQRLPALRPDVVLLNPTLPDVSLPQLRAAAPATALVALLYQYVPHSVLRQYDAVVDVQDSVTTLVATLAQVATQPTTTTTGPSQHADAYRLTPRERAVLVELAQGKTNKQIADSLNVSVHTVISHRKNIIHKTGIKSVAGLTVYAMMGGLIDSPTND